MERGCISETHAEARATRREDRVIKQEKQMRDEERDLLTSMLWMRLSSVAKPGWLVEA